MAKVLIVDDEKSIRATLCAFLADEGHTVADAPDAETALKRLEQEAFDVVVTDIVLPGLNGVELLRAIRQAAPVVQVIMMTGEPTVETAGEAVRCGATDYLSKPIAKVAILKAVANATHTKRIDDERRRLDAVNRQHQENLEQLVMARTTELLETNRRLRAAMRGTVETMSRVVESRDPYTAGHQRRVAQLVRAMARARGFPGERVEAMYMAAIIHDLGKIGIPAEILSKPGRLTRIEFELIKTHPEVGADILHDVDFGWPLREAVLQHHERMDGSGYPRGLSGGSIAEEARILAVADVVEAMAAHRPYRPSLGIERALEEIETNRERLYDPQAVDACLQVFHEGGFEFDSAG